MQISYASSLFWIEIISRSLNSGCSSSDASELLSLINSHKNYKSYLFPTSKSFSKVVISSCYNGSYFQNSTKFLSKRFSTHFANFSLFVPNLHSDLKSTLSFALLYFSTWALIRSRVFYVILSYGINWYLSSYGFGPFMWKHFIWTSSLIMFSLKGPIMIAIKGFSSLSKIICYIWWLWMSILEGLTSKVGWEWYQPTMAWFQSSAAFL